MTKKLKILNLITLIREAHPAMVDIFTKGSCMNFFYILHGVFPEAQPWYDGSHIITKIDNQFYDINGICLDSKNYLPLTQMYSKKRSVRAMTQMYNYNNFSISI